jgi:methylated-DNA-[protein]-cysteine S-methyltransferase
VSDPEIVWSSMPGPWGPFHLAATGRGIVAVDWLTTETAFMTRLRRRLGGSMVSVGDGPASVRAHDHLAAAVTALEALLAGRASPSGLRFDIGDRPRWDQDVLATVARIPRGRTASYGEIARQVGAPRAARAVGGAVGRNPIGLLIPCHRVIASDGSIGGYGSDGWGSRDERLSIKRELLRLEGIEVG